VTELYVLQNTRGMTVEILTYGGIIRSISVPDRTGSAANVVLGLKTPEAYRGAHPYFGCITGRYANRIAGGKFTLDGVQYTLATNDGPNALHGGLKGFDKREWSVDRATPTELALSYLSPDGEEGYPGTLQAKVTYWLTGRNELIWEAEATTDKATPVNIVHHTYWNLTGNPNKSINDCVLTLEADKYLPTNAGLIPTGELAPVAGTPMDFTTPTPIGQRVNQDFEALKLGGGYDHCWVLNSRRGMHTAAVVRDPASGRVMELTTDQPAVQFYGGNFLNGSTTGKGGVPHRFRTGMCLETQIFPDSPNQPSFPNCILRPGETYKHRMVHRFSVD